VRERLGDPRVVPSFYCTFPPWHAALSNPGKSDIDIVQNFDANIGLRRMTTGSALPTLPQSVPRGRSISWLHWFASATACQVACPPVRIRLGTSPATEDFYFQAFNVSVSLHVAGYNYNSDWTPLLAGLSPAGMAASLAARSSANRTCPQYARIVENDPGRISSASMMTAPNIRCCCLLHDCWVGSRFSQCYQFAHHPGFLDAGFWW